MNEFYTIGWIVLTLIFIGFFAGYEIAFVSVNRLSIELKKKQGKTSGIILGKFMESPAKFIGACLVGLNIFLVIYGLLFTELVQRVFGFKNHFVELIFDAVLSTLIVLVFGEFLPKAIFKGKNDSLLAFLHQLLIYFIKYYNHWLLCLLIFLNGF